MKHLILIILCTVLLQNTFAQKLDDQEQNFTYQRLPNKPLDKAIKNYKSNVILAYEADIIAQKKANMDEYNKALLDQPKKIAEAKAEYDKAMKQYEADMKAWNDKSVGMKILEKQMLNESTKPSEPYLNKPSEPYLKEFTHQKIFNKDMLSSTYLKLDGYKNAPEQAVIITATLFGFENTEPELKSVEKSYYNSSTKATEKINSYWYAVQYKHPIAIKIEGPDKSIIMDETLTEFNDYKTEETAKTDGKHPPFNKESFLSKLQEKAVTDNMTIVNNYINNQYGFSSVKRKVVIYRVDAKKFTYDDYQSAFENAVSALSVLSSDKKSATEKLQISIDLWEKALKEFDPNNKKARIDEDIAIATRMNLSEAYIWLNDFVNADLQLTKIMGLKPSNRQEKAAKAQREFLQDQKNRWEANNQ